MTQTNKSEAEIEKTAIDQYLDDLESHQVFDDWKELLKYQTVSVESLEDQMISELNNVYQIDMSNDGNRRYLIKQFDERMNSYGINLGKSIWEV